MGAKEYQAATRQQSVLKDANFICMGDIIECF